MRTSPVSRLLTGRRSAWLVLALWIAAMVGATMALSGLSTAARGANLPEDVESRVAAARLQEFPDADTTTALLVATKADGSKVTGAEIGQFTDFIKGLAQGGRPMVLPSEDGQALLATVTLPATDDDSVAKENVKELRAKVDADAPAGLEVLVTGGPAFGADISSSFDGANVTLLLTTVGIVAFLLLLTYRSPVLWLVPLFVVGMADQLATKTSNGLSLATGWHAEGGIVSVLVFGAGANYALLLISRYRELLRTTDDHREALQGAWHATLPAIVASNFTVVLGLLTLLFAALPDTRGLGLSAGVGLLIALVSVLVALPAALAICGRRVFWPFVPRPGEAPRGGDLWGRLAGAVVRRPIAWLAAGLALLALFAGGLTQVKVGLDQNDQFRVSAESIDGLEKVSQHYPAGFTSPITVVAKASATQRVVAALKQDGRVTQVMPTGTGGEWVRLLVTGQPAPGTPEQLDLVRELRQRVHAVSGADAVVGGPAAEDLDQRELQDQDFRKVAPLVLLVSLLVLFALTRSAVAPWLLLAVNVLSAAAAVGAGTWVSKLFIDAPALAVQVPLFAFLFLVALGIDYTIFLIDRARHEADLHGTRRGMIEAVRHTGAVITSAGVVLASVFVALGVLPLVVMGQLGVIVALGVLVDTLVVRTVIVPALFALIGDRMWWPHRPTSETDPEVA